MLELVLAIVCGILDGVGEDRMNVDMSVATQITPFTDIGLVQYTAI